MREMPDYIELFPSKILKNKPTIKYKNKFIHSKYDPVKQAMQEIKRHPNLSTSRLIIVLGVGYGYILDALKQVISESTKVIIVDKEEYFQNFIDKKNLYNSNFKFFWGEAGFNINEYLVKNYFEYDIKNITIVENSVLADIERSYYDSIKSKILKFFKMRTADITTTAYFSDIWLRNILLNFKTLDKISFISNYKNIFRDEDILFISASPFIERYIKSIKKFRGYIFTLAPAVEYLIKNGVLPDFVISTDANYYNLYHIMKHRKLNLITELSIHPAVLSNWQGEIIIMDFNLPPTSIIKNTIGDIGVIPQGGTVSVTALHLFNYLGIKNIFIVGQDFSYNGFKTHCNGSGYDKVYLLRNNRFKRIILQNFLHIHNNKLDYISNNIITDEKFIMYKDWFNNTVRELDLNLIPLTSNSGMRVRKNKFIYKKESINKDKFRDYISEIYNIINGINIKDFSSFRELIINLQKDIQIYNLFSMLMYRELMRYKTSTERDEYYFNKFEEVKKVLLKSFEFIMGWYSCE